MQNKKRIAALLVAAALIVGGIAVSFADEPVSTPTTTITITTDVNIKSTNFVAYRLLDVVTSEKDGETVYKYSVNAKYRSALQQLTDASTDNEIITALSKLSAEEARVGANQFYELGLEADYETTEAKFADVPQGYYLIAETSPADDYDSISLVMVDTAAKETVSIKTKEDVPSSQKKVKDVNDSIENSLTDWQDSADYDIGDKVPFQLTATLPSNYDCYEKYQLTFHDEEIYGLTFDKDSVVVKVNGTTVPSQLYTVLTDTDDDCSFEIVMPNTKQFAESASDVITVEYESTLNEEAKIGAEGNPNKMYMTFSNNPYGEGEGQTPDDYVVVFTYKTIVNKVDGSGDPLKGAGFTLYKYDAAKKDYVATKHGEIKGEDITRFEFTGIDDGKYKLVETTVPAGYNQADDIEFEVTATHMVESAAPQLTALSVGENKPFVVKYCKGTMETTIENLTGRELPETGGMGTKLFYILGGALLVGGVTIFIVRKKTNKDEE